MNAKRKKLIDTLKKESDLLSLQLEKIINARSFPKDAFSYNPLNYARDSFFTYIDNYAHCPLDALFLGMNPGPNGMMQTGIPFGDVSFVKNYLGIQSGVHTPSKEHPKRPILGFDCPKGEVSGTRLWSFFQSEFPDPNSFFKKFFVLNYCPLGFLSATGANVTPDKIELDTRKKIEMLCDEFLLKCVPLFEVKTRRSGWLRH
ncbi:MAG: single-stranded DNA-binding protein [Bdellovibrionota bacterium]